MELKQFSPDFRSKSFICGMVFGVVVMAAAWYVV